MSHVTIDGRRFELDKQSGPARQQAMKHQPGRPGDSPAAG